MASALVRHDLIVATFNPLKTSDLRDDCRALIGKRCSFTAGWEIESGVYAGQMAMVPAWWPCNIGWVPECDLQDLEFVGGERG